MKIIIFTDSKNTAKLFDPLKKAKDCSLELHPRSDLKKKSGSLTKDSIIYLDVSDYKEADRKKALAILEKLTGYRYGIIDPKGAVIDMAGLFHSGASDYIGRDLAKKGINAKRPAQVAEFKAVDIAVKTTPVKKNYILSGKDWKEIKSGKEYTFCFMFIELDNQKEMRTIYGNKLGGLLKNFHDIVGATAAKINGRVWMWTDFGGLLLFPFDGKNCDSILMGFKLILDRTIMTVEDLKIDNTFSYRIAIHIGNTLYQTRGNTGNIISDSINSIYHIGYKFAEPGDFCITQDAVEFIPKGLADLFKEAGEFEGRVITRLKRLS
ncbi:MAG: hypothetical protein MUD12_06955 [Spirochaetes bacterium]|jgi:hypothetical protein|nr:hypothetical protein [Spirochaetota bacterium]